MSPLQLFFREHLLSSEGKFVLFFFFWQHITFLLDSNFKQLNMPDWDQCMAECKLAVKVVFCSPVLSTRKVLSWMQKLFCGIWFGVLVFLTFSFMCFFM